MRNVDKLEKMNYNLKYQTKEVKRAINGESP